MSLSGRTFEIVGVFPRDAAFPDAAALWVPLAGDPNQQGQSYSYAGMGRLKPGDHAWQQAEQDLLRAQEPIWTARDKDKVVSPFTLPLRENFVSEFRTIASALWGAVALLLVVACANVAAVMLARAIARRREMGIRLAIGANRFRLLRQLFVENIVLAIVGGAIGVALGRWALKVLVSAADTALPAWAPFGFDGRIVAFCDPRDGGDVVALRLGAGISRRQAVTCVRPWATRPAAADRRSRRAAGGRSRGSSARSSRSRRCSSPAARCSSARSVRCSAWTRASAPITR